MYRERARQHESLPSDACAAILLTHCHDVDKKTSAATVRFLPCMSIAEKSKNSFSVIIATITVYVR